jgi:hypothetical protein
MNLFNLFNQNLENRNITPIGSVEVPQENLASMIMGMMNSMGLVNPGAVTTTSSKAVTVTKKGNTYVITLNMYTPPITFTWTGLLPADKLAGVILKLIEDNRKINYINQINTDKGNFVQLGIS